MKSISIVFWALGLSCLSAWSQTNCDPSASKLFAMPHAELRRLDSHSEKLHQTASSDVEQSQVAAAPRPSLDSSRAVTGDFSSHWTLDNFRSDFDRRMYQRLEDGGYLERPTPNSENRFDRCVTAIFKPEVFQVGKTSVSCSLLTAIKRRNPLCLINPIFFNLSW
jgi:hypothetical protein